MLLSFEGLSKPLTIIRVIVVVSSLGHYGIILHKLASAVHRFVSLGHQPRKLPTHGLLRSFVYVLMLLLRVLEHALTH